MVEAAQLRVRTLGDCRIESPLGALVARQGTTEHYVDESDRVLLDDTLAMLAARKERGSGELPSFEPGGPRRRICFDPSKIRVGIVTCGGLCPGLNDVIRGPVLMLNVHYGVTRIVGFRNGYQGLVARHRRSVVELTPSSVEYINEQAGGVPAAPARPGGRARARAGGGRRGRRPGISADGRHRRLREPTEFAVPRRVAAA